jgi:glutathione peroxidase
MNLAEKLIASTYDFRMKFSKKTGLGISIETNPKIKAAPVDFYSLTAIANNGDQVPFENFREKKVLLVNLASKCGFTPQYKELEQLHQRNRELVILGFPSNNFGGQEPGTDLEIARFCETNFNVTFPFFKKGNVKGINKQPVYQWLCDPEKNGWNSKEPKWNFYKYLVSETGQLLSIFSSSVSPLDINFELEN